VALEHASAGAQLCAATEDGVPVRDIAEAIARHLGIPARSIPDDELEAHFGAFRLIGMGVTMPNESTWKLLDWKPEYPGLIADLDEGHYFAAPR
jgi:nucleoside-diphosphate-sugar epimerase